MWRRKYSGLMADIERLRARLESGKAASANEIAKCHAARLVLEQKNFEKRLRSIQTLAGIRDPVAIGPCINDLVSLSKKWANEPVGEICRILVETLCGLDAGSTGVPPTV